MEASLDTCFIFALSKKEIHHDVCENFLNDISEVSCNIVLLKTVEDEYFKVLSERLNILKAILKKTAEDFLKSKRTYDDFKKLIRKNIQYYRKKTNKSAREWINQFEINMNYKADRVYREKKNVGAVFIELDKELQEYERNFYTTYELIKAKSSCIVEDPPNEILSKSFNRKIKNLNDCDHLSVVLKYAIENDKWMFFITLDNTDLASEQKRNFICKNYFFIRVEVPMYALGLIEKFIEKDSPLTEIRRMTNPSSELKELAKLVREALSINIPLNTSLS